MIFVNFKDFLWRVNIHFGYGKSPIKPYIRGLRVLPNPMPQTPKVLLFCVLRRLRVLPNPMPQTHPYFLAFGIDRLRVLPNPMPQTLLS